MANPVQKKQQPQGPETPISHQKFKAKLTQWLSYITGDMAAFGEWMKGTRVSQISIRSQIQKEGKTTTLILLVNSQQEIVCTKVIQKNHQ